MLAPCSLELRTRLSTRTLLEFFANNLRVARSEKGSLVYFYAEANLLAHWANLGYLEEPAICHILQSLISHSILHDHQADALIILFRLAGATFEAYADPSVVSRCFELLKGHSYEPPYKANDNYYAYLSYCSSSLKKQECENDNNNYVRVKGELVQVRTPRPGH